jgi:hypothetical protein
MRQTGQQKRQCTPGTSTYAAFFGDQTPTEPGVLCPSEYPARFFLTHDKQTVNEDPARFIREISRTRALEHWKQVPLHGLFARLTSELHPAAASNACKPLQVLKRTMGNSYFWGFEAVWYEERYGMSGSQHAERHYDPEVAHALANWDPTNPEQHVDRFKQLTSTERALLRAPPTDEQIREHEDTLETEGDSDSPYPLNGTCCLCPPYAAPKHYEACFRHTRLVCSATANQRRRIYKEVNAQLRKILTPSSWSLLAGELSRSRLSAHVETSQEAPILAALGWLIPLHHDMSHNATDYTSLTAWDLGIHGAIPRELTDITHRYLRVSLPGPETNKSAKTNCTSSRTRYQRTSK